MLLAACGFIFVGDDLDLIVCDADTCTGDKNTKLFWADSPYGYQWGTSDKSLVPIASKPHDISVALSRYVDTIQQDVVTSGIIRVLYEGKERIAILKETEEDVYSITLLEQDMSNSERVWDLSVDPVVEGDEEYDELEDFFLTNS